MLISLLSDQVVGTMSHSYIDLEGEHPSLYVLVLKNEGSSSCIHQLSMDPLTQRMNVTFKESQNNFFGDQLMINYKVKDSINFTKMYV